jgi:hypothetical protein
MGDLLTMSDHGARPAFYAASPGRWRDWWTLLHPPYTAWHLSYVAIGSALAPRLDLERFAEIMVAFFLGLGISAHALDELNGRPLRTRIPDRTLQAAAALGLVGAVTLGIRGTTRIGPELLPFIAVAVFAVLAYNLEWFGGRFHTDAAFAAFWGALPVLAGYFVQAERIDIVAVMGAAAAYGLSAAQRILSGRARFIRRKVSRARVELKLEDGTSRDMNKDELLLPFDLALHTLSWSMVVLAAALVAVRIAS